MQHKLVLASTNPHKLEELRRALPGLGDRPARAQRLPAGDGGDVCGERGRQSAIRARAHLGADAWVVGEDSGIEVAALDGRPGVDSARWAADGVTRLLAELEAESDRQARYVCAIVAIGPAGREIGVQGTLEGAIVEGPPRGAEGFGYDPIFVPLGETLTVAELGDAWKREHSHRAVAAAQLAHQLQAV